MKKLILLVLVFIVSSFPLFADGVQPSGSGTLADPYQVATLDNLLWISTNSQSWSSHFIQTAYIDATDTQNWNYGAGFSPIGNISTGFNGTYDGNGHIIQNLYIFRHAQDNMGFFGFINNATIQNIGLTNVEVYGNNVVGSLVGLMVSSTLESCFSTGIVESQNSWAGGLVGGSDYTNTITNCYSSASVSGLGRIGGLCGFFDNGSVTNCYSRGIVNGNSFVGGLIGQIESATITNSFWDTQTSGQTTSAGGTAKATAEMNNFYTYYHAGWDFMDETFNGANDYWGMNPSMNNGYPFLSYQGYQNSYATPAGNGTVANPYQIHSLLDLQWLSEMSSSWDKHFIQTADIDASDTQNWNNGAGFKPIGNGSPNFTGSYDGGGYTIENLYINRPGSDDVGLFGIIYFSNIQNIGLINVEIYGYDTTGGLAGLSNNSTITNCNCEGSVIGNEYSGNLFGYIIDSTIGECYSKGSVSGLYAVGGIVGYANYNNMLVNCYSTSDVFGVSYIGGLIGLIDDGSLSDCYSTGEINGYGFDDGGLIGKINFTSPTISNCFWDMETSGLTISAGGIGKTTDEMKSYHTFFEAGWDFTNETVNGTNDYWGMNPIENNGYPFLASQGYDNCIQQPSGAGTVNNPYLISNIKELAWVSEVSSSWSSHFLQTADIDAADTQSWNNSTGFRPIGNTNTYFTGSYDGGNHIIQNLYINNSEYSHMGMFGLTNLATIKNIGLENVNFVGNINVAGLIGYSIDSFIENCLVSGNVNGIWYVGGLVGYNNGTSIANSYCNVNVNGSSSVGGLIGRLTDSSISNCYSRGEVSGSLPIGGLIGETSGANTVTSCLWDTEISGQSTSAAGTGKTTLEMKNYNTYLDAGWDFVEETTNGTNDPWGINPADNDGYPFLAWQGYTNFFLYPLPSGSGTVEAPYQISTLNELRWLSETQSLWDKHFIQITDIDATDTSNWNSGAGFSPIGTTSNNFTGSYNGNGFSIQNLYINRTAITNQAVGLFGTINNATIENLGLVDVIMYGYWFNGSLVANSMNSTINNCFSIGTVSGNNWSGGLIGAASQSTISNCFSSGNVVGANAVGGFVADLIYSTISNCYSAASVNGNFAIGGLAGQIQNEVTIINSYSIGSVSGSGQFGGLVGQDIDNNSTITSCFWDTETSGQSISAGGSGKTTAEMKDYFTFYDASWDFMDETANGIEDDWGINSMENDGYPFLAWQGFAHALMPSGEGTEGNPYQISSLSNLAWISSNQSVWDKYFIQTADIDAADTQNWNDGKGFTPIGKSDFYLRFEGTYDGNEHIIQNLYINRIEAGSFSSYSGLFAYTELATLKNIRLQNIEINGYFAVGALVGKTYKTNIVNCHSSGVVTGNSSVGGLMGQSALSNIMNCFSIGEASGNDMRIAGLIGYSFQDTLSNCYSTGNVSGDERVGGLIGDSYECIVTNCYSTGTVQGNLLFGGLIGNDISTRSVFNACFWDMETSNQATSGGGTGKTTAEMKDYYTFYDAGWDFMDETTNGSDDYWGINPVENDGYPFLAWQGYTHNINLEAPSDVTISISGNEVTLNWTEVAGASSYLIFAADSPDSTFIDVTAQGNFGTPRNEKNLNHRLKKAINNKRILSSEETRSIQSWTITTSSTKKFYYVKASN